MFRLTIPVFLLIFIQQIDCCKNITDSSTFDFSLTLEPGCTHFLPIYHDKSIQLNLHCDTKVDIWLIVTVEKQNHTIFHSNFSSQCSRTEARIIPWQAPKSTGLKIFVQSEKEMEIKVTVEDDDNVCGFPYVQFDKASTVIQEDLNFTNFQDCVYRLIPSNDSLYNAIEIDFNIRTKYEQRIYRTPEWFETKLHHEPMRKFIFLEFFDLKTEGYFESPQITATPHHNPCYDGINTLYVYPYNTTTKIEIPNERTRQCQYDVSSIYKIHFMEMQPNEVVFFDNYFHDRENYEFELYQLDSHEHIMSHSNSLFKIAVKTSGLYFEIKNVNTMRTNTFSFTRVKIGEGCNCSVFNEGVYHHNKHIDLTFPKHCENIFCSWKIVNRFHGTINLRTLVDSPSPTDFFDGRGYWGNGPATIYERERTESMKYPLTIIVFYRFNATVKEDTTIHLSWDISLNCECPQEHMTLGVNEQVNVTSQNYPTVYCPNMRCPLFIKTSDSAILELSINEFQLDSSGDHLLIHNGNTTDDEKNCLEDLAGYHSRGDIQVNGNQIAFLFESDGVTKPNDKGYHITVRSREKSSLKTTEAMTTTEGTKTERTVSTTKSTTTTTTLPSTTTSSTSEPLPNTSTTSEPSEQSHHSYTLPIMIFIFLTILLGVVGFLYQQKRLRRQMLFSSEPPHSMTMHHNSLY